MRCESKSFAKITLCVSDLNRFVQIVERSIVGDHPDDLVQVNSKGNTLIELYGAVETTSPQRPIAGINTVEKITHVYYFRHSDFNCDVDVSKHVIHDNCSVYRIDSYANLNEMNETIALYCIKSNERCEYV